MYTRGDRVLVEGFGGDRAVLRVWGTYKHGLALCSEVSYLWALRAGEEAEWLGFPMQDIKEKVDGPANGAQPQESHTSSTERASGHETP